MQTEPERKQRTDPGPGDDWGPSDGTGRGLETKKATKTKKESAEPPAGRPRVGTDMDILGTEQMWSL